MLVEQLKKQEEFTEVMTALTSANYIMDVLFVSLLDDNYKEDVESSVEVWKLRQRNEPKVQK